MSATFTPSTSRKPSGSRRAARIASAEIIRPLLIALAVFVLVAGIGLGIALVTSATLVFNILVWAGFSVLWIAFGAALAFSPGTLDALWQSVRELPLVIQGVAWLFFLPIMIGLWIWERTWALPIRLALVIAIGVWNVFLFFPR